MLARRIPITNVDERLIFLQGEGEQVRAVLRQHDQGAGVLEGGGQTRNQGGGVEARHRQDLRLLQPAGRVQHSVQPGRSVNRSCVFYAPDSSKNDRCAS